jgi:hypothetical protein
VYDESFGWTKCKARQGVKQGSKAIVYQKRLGGGWARSLQYDEAEASGIEIRLSHSSK